MTSDEFLATVSQGAVRPAYLFSGPEQFLKREALGALREKLLPPGFEPLNESVFEAETAERIIEACETQPLMCEKRLTLVYDWPPLMPGRARDESAQTERILDWLKNPAATNCLVFYTREAPDAKKKLTQSLRKLATCVDFTPLDDAAVARWAAGRLKPRGKRIGFEAASALVFSSGRALTALDQELDKLAAYTGDRAEITVADVEAIATRTVECTIFQMIDAVLEGRQTRARGLLKATLEGGQTRLGVVAALTRQMRMLTHIRLLRQKGSPLPQIQKELELNPYAASRAEKQARRFKPETLEKAYLACVDAEYSVKSGQAREEDVLELLLRTITRG